MWVFVFFIGASHLVQDSIKLNYAKIKYSFLAYSLDQLFHVAIIATVFLNNLKYLGPVENSGNIIVELYNDSTFIIYVIILLAASYNGFYMVRSFKNSFWGGAGVYSSFEKWYGMLERAAITSLFFLPKAFLWAVVPIILGRQLIFLMSKSKLRLHRQFISLKEMALGWIIAGLTGLAGYLLIVLSR